MHGMKLKSPGLLYQLKLVLRTLVAISMLLLPSSRQGELAIDILLTYFLHDHTQNALTFKAPKHTIIKKFGMILRGN